jgi:hypothetical protein
VCGEKGRGGNGVLAGVACCYGGAMDGWLVGYPAVGLRGVGTYGEETQGDYSRELEGCYDL